VKEENLPSPRIESANKTLAAAPADQDQQLGTCASLLDATLANVGLPESVSRRLRNQFSGRVFDPSKLQQEVNDALELVSELTGAAVVKGPGRISEMTSSEDQITAAVHDLLGAKRPAGLENVHPARLSGIRELYLRMTGDDTFSGGYDARRAQFAASSSSRSMVKRSTPGIDATASRRFSPSSTKTGRIRSFVVSTFSRTRRREKSSRRLRRRRVAGNRRLAGVKLTTDS